MNLNIIGASSGVDVSDTAFGREFNEALVHQVVTSYMADARQGTKAQKTRSEVNGGGRKPYRQKGTGNARPGSKRSPLWRHGGRVFGPRPRSYGFKLNKKIKRLARRSALTYKAREERITVLENFSMNAPKTKEFKNILSALSLDATKVLLVLPEHNQNVYLSSRNLPKATVVRAEDLNTYDILNAHTLVVVEEAMQKIEQQLG